MKGAISAFFVASILSVTFLAVNSHSAVPNLINYQGMLLDSTGSPMQGNKLVKYTIYDKSGSEIWNSGFINTAFTDGLFTAQLGASPQPVLPANMCADDSSLTLGVTVDVNPEFSPRTRLVTAPYAFESEHAGSVDWTGVTNIPADIADGDDGGTTYLAGTGLDLTGATFSVEPGGITASELADNSVSELKIVDGSVFSIDIANGTINVADINPGAAIAPTMISGTAATLSNTQTFTNSNTFSNTLLISDSTFRANSTGVSIGRATNPSGLRMVSIERAYNTTGLRYGTYTSLSNAGTGQVYGLSATAASTGGGTTYGANVEGNSDAVNRYGIFATGGPTTNGLNTGNSFGVYGVGEDGDASYGVFGVSTGNNTSYGVFGFASTGVNRYGVYGSAVGGTVSYAGYFSGNAHVAVTLTKGAGAFKIDHPLDPENKFLQHSFVESPDMMNIYNGNVTADANGEAVVTMPEWFSALNMEIRYQLTPIGAPSPNLHIKEEVFGNRFVIGGAEPKSKVSWQVTGIRNDKLAQSNRIQVEIDKRPDERGKYAHPEAFGLSAERGIDYEHTRHTLPEVPERGEE